MTMNRTDERIAQDAFQSMVGETGPYPNDPQHPDPGFEPGSPADAGEQRDQGVTDDGGACFVE